MNKRHYLAIALVFGLLPFAAAIDQSAAIASAAQQGAGGETRSDQIAAGKRIFNAQCTSCHGAGIGNPGFAHRPGTDALYAKYKNELPPLLEDRRDLTPETVAFFVRQGVSIMPFYRKTEISDAELAQLGAYLSRNNKDLK